MTTVAMSSTEKIGDEQFFLKLHSFMYSFILPIILALGFFGNLMNLFILTGKRIQHSLRNSEKSANTGLIALTISDLAFCITAFPTTFLPADNQFKGEPGFYAYYGLYSPAVISVFIMASTWLTVALAVERYRAICRPLSSRRIVSNMRTICIIVFIFIFSFLFNVPMFLKVEFETKYVNTNGSYISPGMCHVLTDDINKNLQFLREKITEKNTSEERKDSESNLANRNFMGDNSNKSFLFPDYNYDLNHTNFINKCDNSSLQKVISIRSTTSTDDVSEHVFRLMWSIVGNAIPLITLAFCNTTLLLAIHKSYALRKQMNRSLSKSSSTTSDHDSSQRITITLVCIVAMFLVLVAPSEIVKYYSILFSSNLDTNFHFKSIEVITNVMQSLNFSVNFILYCIVNPSFRKTMCEMISLNKRLRKSSTLNHPSRPLSFSSVKGTANYLRNNNRFLHHSSAKKVIIDCGNNNCLVASSLLKKNQDTPCSYKHVVVKLSKECVQPNSC